MIHFNDLIHNIFNMININYPANKNIQWKQTNNIKKNRYILLSKILNTMCKFTSTSIKHTGSIQIIVTQRSFIFWMIDKVLIFSLNMRNIPDSIHLEDRKHREQMDILPLFLYIDCAYKTHTTESSTFYISY